MSAQPRLWLSEKVCYLCHTSLGHGSHRPKKLHCRTCFHAICPQCSLQTSHSTQVLCRSCKDTSEPVISVEAFRAETPLSDLAHLDSPLKEPSFECGSSISDSFEDGQMLTSVLHSAKQLVQAMNSHSRIEKDPLSDQIQKYSQQLRNRHSEIELLRDQEKWYATQLVARDAEIKELTYEVAVLSSRNYDFETQLRQVVRRRKSLGSLPQSEAACCGSCALF